MSTIQSEVVNALRKHLKKEVEVISAPTGVTSKTPVVVAEDEVLFSKVFGYKPSFGDFPVRVLPAPDASIARFVPRVDADYVIQKEEAAILVAGLMDNDKTLITGPTGSGKSSLCKYVAAKLNWPFIRVNMSGDVESAALFGAVGVADGATHWTDGAITEACKVGAIVLVDEWELMPAEIAMGMQNLLEEDGYLYLKEKPGTSDDRTVIPTSNFRMLFAGNTVGQGDTTGAFNGVGVQNTATVDRFTSTIKLDYLHSKHEIAFITNKTGLDSKVAAQMVKFAGLVRNAYNQGKVGLTMSPRTLINWGNKQKRYNVEFALGVAYLQKLSDDDKVSVKELYKKVFGEVAKVDTPIAAE